MEVGEMLCDKGDDAKPVRSFVRSFVRSIHHPRPPKRNGAPTHPSSVRRSVAIPMGVHDNNLGFSLEGST